MSNELKKILREAQEVLSLLESGKTYPMNYVVNRFEKAASENSGDQLIGNMRDVLVKMSSRQDMIEQKQIGNLFDKMYGLSGGHTAFRDALGDLLPDNRQIAKVAYNGSKTRQMEERPLAPIHSDSELSNAFSVLFSIGESNAFSSFKPGKDKSVEKAVIAKLSGLGYCPDGVDIIETNEHFALAAATHKTASSRRVTTLIPVQISSGVTQEPKHIILGDEAVNLDGKNLYLAIKEQENYAKKGQARKVASSRDSVDDPVQVRKYVVPSSLEQFADLENTLVAVASKFDIRDINLATTMLGAEFASFGAFNPEVKLAGAGNGEILFDVYVPTKLGKVALQVPVEINQGTPLMPRKFAAKTSSADITTFDFSEGGFRSFMGGLDNRSASLSAYRENGPMLSMSYHQLMDQMIDGVASKDYRLAEDSLQTIQARFGGQQYIVAFDKFSQLLKHSSDSSSSRGELIKAAFERGDLIKVSTSVDLYCPKLGLPVSKVEFDERGRVIAKGRRSKSENQVRDTQINTSRIILT